MVIDSSQFFSLYFHIPFCKKKCDYCHFYVLPDQANLHDLLLEGLCKEWSKIKEDLKGRSLVSIYFGGGTPSLFGPKNISTLLNLINIEFDLVNVEITLEVNPETISLELMQAYHEVGINRVSIGVQSLNDSELRLLTREHDGTKAIEAIQHTVNSGIKNISIDLMYDLPHQTLDHWENTLQKAIELPITHLSLYNLTIEPHTPFFKYRNKLLPNVPNENTSLEMYQLAIKTFEKAGLHQYEISAFAREGMKSKHNSGYWSGRSFLGLGPSAFSYWNGQRFRNIAHLKKYHEALFNDKSPVDFIDNLSLEERKRELFVVGLRLKEGLNLVDFEAKFGALEDTFESNLNNLINYKLIQKNDPMISLTEQGTYLYDSIATELI